MPHGTLAVRDDCVTYGQLQQAGKVMLLFCTQLMIVPYKLAKTTQEEGLHLILGTWHLINVVTTTGVILRHIIVKR